MRLLPALFIVLSLAAPATAEQERPRQERPHSATTQPASVDVDRLPLNLNRIQRQLKHAADLEQREGLNLRYVIHIYGSAPSLQIFNEDANLANGPVPYGAPTHRELINHVTPQEFRAPVADFSALLRWLADREKAKGKR
jgi:hypothetical protein